jgi:ABC-type multidrug transport system, ATPase and permease components
MMVLWTVRAALRILPRRLRWKWAALAPLILAATAVELLAAGTIYLMVRRASSGTISISFVAVVAAVFLGRNLLQWIVAMLQSSVTAQSMAAVFSALLAGTLAAPYRFHLQHRPTEQIQRLTAAIDTAYRLVLAPAAGLASEILIVIALTALLIVKAPLNAGITAVILSSAVIAVLAGTRRSVARWGREVYERGGQTIAHVQEILGGVREVKSAQRERPFLERAAAVQMEFSEALRRHLLALAVPRLVTETSFVIIALAMVDLSGSRGSRHRRPARASGALRVYRIPAHPIRQSRHLSSRSHPSRRARSRGAGRRIS